jgi:hypothetical protein
LDFKNSYNKSDLPKDCLGCGLSYELLHHRTYTRLGIERLTDVIPLCRPCHKKIHDFEKISNINLQHCHAIMARVFNWTKETMFNKFVPFGARREGHKVNWFP